VSLVPPGRPERHEPPPAVGALWFRATPVPNVAADGSRRTLARAGRLAPTPVGGYDDGADGSQRTLPAEGRLAPTPVGGYDDDAGACQPGRRILKLGRMI